MLIPLVGPLDGVTLIVINSAITSLLMTIGSYRDIAWGRLLLLSIPSAIVAFPVILVLNSVPEVVTSLVVGGLLLVCTVLLTSKIEIRQLRGSQGPAVAGLVSGFLNASAGVAGPSLGVFATSVGWSHRTFVATAQPFFIVSDLAVLGAKGCFQEGPQDFLINGSAALIAVLGCMLGLYAGSKVVGKISEEVGRRLVIIVSAAGAIGTLVSAAIGLAQL